MKKITPSSIAIRRRVTNLKGAPPLVSMAIIGCLTALLTCPAIATLIIVPNFSFEANAGGDGNFVSAADDWTITGTFTSAGSYNPVDAQFSGTTLANGGTVPLPGEGTDISLSNLARSDVADSAFASFTSLNSLVTVTNGLLYTLTVAGGNRADLNQNPDQYTIEMLVDGVSAASKILNGNTIPDDSFQDITTSFIATSGQAGKDLTIRLTHSTFIGSDSSSASGHFDNVRLTSLAVPEPSTAILSLMGTLLLLRYRKRRYSF